MFEGLSKHQGMPRATFGQVGQSRNSDIMDSVTKLQDHSDEHAPHTEVSVNYASPGFADKSEGHS